METIFEWRLYGSIWQHLEKYRSQNHPKSMMELQIVDASEIAAHRIAAGQSWYPFQRMRNSMAYPKITWMIERGTGATPILSSGIPSKSC